MNSLKSSTYKIWVAEPRIGAKTSIGARPWDEAWGVDSKLESVRRFIASFL